MKPRREPSKNRAADLGLELAQLPHDHELVVAARLALEMRADRMLSGDDYPGGRYHRLHDLPELTALDRARYGPTGDRGLWVRYGPDGPAIPEQRQPEWTAADDAGAARVRGD